MGALSNKVKRFAKAAGIAKFDTRSADNALGQAGLGDVSMALPRGKNVVTQKLMGFNIQTGSTLANSTWQVKLTAEADFDAIQIGYLNHQGNAVVVSASVAATETAATDTTSNMSDPVVGGVAYTALDSTADAHGWRSVTWAGASSVAAPAAAIPSGQIPNNPAAIATPSISLSDWIPIRSVPRADGGTLPLVMLRFYIDGAANAFSFVADSARLPLLRTATSANRGRILQVSNVGNNGVTTPAIKPSSLGTTMMPFFIRLRCRRRGVTVIGIGDSNFQNDVLVADKFSTWLFRACADLSSPDLPIAFVNAGCSSQNSTTYWQHGKQMMAAVRPDVAVYEVWTPNDNPYADAAATRFKVMNMLAKAQDFVDYCLQNSIVPILSTGIPYVAMTAATDPERIWLINEVKKLAQSGLVGLIDTNSGIGDGAIPERILAAYDYGDGIHQNETAIEAVLAPQAKAAIRQA